MARGCSAATIIACGGGDVRNDVIPVEDFDVDALSAQACVAFASSSTDRFLAGGIDDAPTVPVGTAVFVDLPESANGFGGYVRFDAPEGVTAVFLDQRIPAQAQDVDSDEQAPVYAETGVADCAPTGLTYVYNFSAGEVLLGIGFGDVGELQFVAIAAE